MKVIGLSILLSVSALMVACESSPPAGELAQERSGTWIDVRGPDEYSAGHLDGAVNIPHDVIGDRIASVAPNKDAEIHLYCRSGRRSNIALEALEEKGYTNVTNEGGYAELKGQ